MRGRAECVLGGVERRPPPDGHRIGRERLVHASSVQAEPAPRIGVSPHPTAGKPKTADNKPMTRVRLPEGVYDTDQLDLERWDEIRDVPGVEIECARHPDEWWPTAGKGVAAADLRDWRCPNCAWAFRRKISGTGGTPQF